MTADPAHKPTPAARQELVDFFQAAFHAFRRAERAVGGPVSRFYRIGGHVVRLRFAGPALVPLITPALGHLAEEPAPDPALTVCLWDKASTGVGMPPPPWSAEDYVARGEIDGYSDDRIYTAFNLGSGEFNMLDTRRDVALYWVRSGGQLRYWEMASPLRAILCWWMRGRGLQFVHAGGVGTSHGCALIVGKGGAGKSTTSLICLDAGLTYLGDNHCLVTKDRPPRVYSVYSSATMRADWIVRFPHLMSGIRNRDRLEEEKALVFLDELLPGSVTAEGLPVRAILLPRVTGLPRTRIREGSPIMSLTELAPSTVLPLPGTGREDFENMSALVKRVPNYILELGTEFSEIPKVIADLLADQEMSAG